MIDFFTRPFSVTALLLTGANLATALGQKSQQSDLGSMYFVSIPICLVVAKNFLCPYVSLAASELLLPGSSNNRWHSFAFLYGLIPTSSAPWLFQSAASPMSCPTSLDVAFSEVWATNLFWYG